MDVNRLKRLQHAIRAAAEVDAGTGSGAVTIGAQYNALRLEVSGALPEGLTEEFERLFPPAESSFDSGALGPRQLVAMADLAKGTSTRLRTLVGWLEGVIATTDDRGCS